MPVKKEPQPLSSLVDELGELEEQLAPLKPKIARAEAIRKAIRDQHADADANAVIPLTGAKYEAVLGPRGSQTVVDKLQLMKAIGSKLFAQIASVTIAALNAHIEPSIVTNCCSTEQTGPRTLSIRPL